MTARHRAADTRKGRRRKTGKPKPRQTATRSRRSDADAQEQLDQALQQQSATAEVLRIIASSPGDLDRIFKTILANAVRLCEARFGAFYLHEGDALRLVAAHNVPPALAQARKRGPIRPLASTPLARAIKTKRPVQTADLAATEPYAKRHPVAVDAVELGGVRTLVAVPMIKRNEVIGIISIFRQEVRPFTDKQIDLVSTFADQAVIAVENAR